MAVRTEPLGVGIVGIGWCAAQHITAFNHNAHAEVRLLCGRDEGRVRASLERSKVEAPGSRITTRFDDLLESPDIDIVAIATPNHLHAAQAVAAARAGKHILLEKPSALSAVELAAIHDAVSAARVRTIVSFELHYNPYIRFVRWLRESGRLSQARLCTENEWERAARGADPRRRACHHARAGIEQPWSKTTYPRS